MGRHVCECCNGSGYVESYTGAEYRAARIAAGCTQRQVAEEVGVGVPYISRIETGRERPSAALLWRLKGVLPTLEPRAHEARAARGGEAR